MTALAATTSRHLQVAALFTVTVALFFPTLQSYGEVWLRDGTIVVLTALVFIWRERGGLIPQSTPWLPPLAAAAVVSTFWLVSTVTKVQVFAQAAMPLLLLLWAAALYGRSAVRALAPMVALFLLVVPFRTAARETLQAWTIVVSGGAVKAMGIEAVMEADLIHTPHGTFLIAQGCSGSFYLFVGLSIAALYAQSYLRTWQGRWAALALAAGLAIVGNWLRVSSLIAIGHASQMQSPFLIEDGPHQFYGWAVFVAVFLAFFALAPRLERWEARKWPSAEAPSPTARESLGWVRAAAYATLVVAIGPLLYLSIDRLPSSDVAPFRLADELPGWREAVHGEEQRPYRWQPAFPAADAHVTTSWTDGSRAVLMDRMLYRRQTRGRELVGYDSRIAPPGGVLNERLLRVPQSGRLVNEALVRDGEDHLLVWYWYRVAGVQTMSPVRAKLLELWGFFSRRTAAELIALSAPCGGDSCVEASEALTSLMAGT